MVEKIFAEDLKYAVAKARRHRRRKNFEPRASQHEVDFGKRKRVMSAVSRYLAQLVRFGSQKFAPRRNIEEQIVHGDLRSARKSLFTLGDDPASGDFDNRAGGRFGLRFQNQVRNRRNRGKRLAAETKRLDRKQIVGLVQFARGVTAKTGPSVLRRHALSIVGDLDPFAAAFFNVDGNLSSSGIQRVFHQFLDHGCWPLHDFPGGYAVGDVVGQNANLHTGI